ncbi:hypothetical protein PspLS_10001 [Pyricularia sp. CBS 133598]|nr:hypothetical protein PspLS_10001 [Pyricularia sp. CBS 133598]
MAGRPSIAASVADLLSLATGITKLSHGFIPDVRSAHSVQKEYLGEISALTDVLSQSKEAAAWAVEDHVAPLSHPAHLPRVVVDDCMKELDSLRIELATPSQHVFGPIGEVRLREHIEKLVRLRGLFSEFIAIAAENQTAKSGTHGKVTNLSLQQNRLELLEWIKGSTNASIPASTPLPGTGVWFLESNLFQDWGRGKGSSQLWCHGPPGVGKSVLASIVLQNLLDNAEDEDQLVLHYFCNFASRKTQTKEAIWRSLLGQAITNCGPSVVETLSTFRSQQPKTKTASLNDLPNIWHVVLSAQTVVLVIDGPDELDSPMVLKGVLAPFVKIGCRIMVTSRDMPEIHSALPLASIQEFLSDPDSLETYVLGQFVENGMEELLERHPNLKGEIVEHASGNFLLVKMLVNHMLELTTVKEIQKALQSYPTQLEAAFEAALERISAQSKPCSALAHRVLNWIASIERPLLASELIHGLAVNQEAKSVSDEDMVSAETMVRVCGGLVVLGPQDGSLSLLHATVYTWLCSRQLARTHEDIAGACLSYLSVSLGLAGPAPSVKEVENRMRDYPFLAYAARHWRAHVHDDMETGPPGTVGKIQEAVEEFIGNPTLTFSAFQVAYLSSQSRDLAPRAVVFDTKPTGQTPIHYAAFWDLPNKIPKMVQAGFDTNAVHSHGWTALHWATFAQNKAAVQALLQAGADINLKDSAGWTPLFWAALHDNVSIVTTLLDNNASHLHRDARGWTALRYAASRQQAPVITLFLKHQSKTKAAVRELPLNRLDSLTLKQISPPDRGLLEEVADMRLDPDEKGRDELFEVLTNDTLEIDDLWSSWSSDQPVNNIWRALIKGEGIYHVHFRRERLGKTSDRQKQYRQDGLLRSAICDGQLPVVRFLLSLGVEPDDHNQWPLLHLAALRKDPGFAEALIQFGADVDLKDRNNMTPLQRALADGFEETARLLVTKGADVNMRGENITADIDAARCPPLVLALGRKCEEEEKVRLVRLLLEHGAEVNTGMLKTPNVKTRKFHYRGFGGHLGFDTAGMTVIHYAAQTRNPNLIRLVIGAGADPKALDEFERTAVHHFCYGYSKPTYNESEDDETKSRPLESVSNALLLLLRECGMDYLNRTAKWAAPCHVIRDRCHSYNTMEAEHSPLSVAVSVADWRMAEALTSFGARLQTNIPLNPMLLKAVDELEVDIVELLLQHGAEFFERGEKQRYPAWRTFFHRLGKAGPQGLPRFEKIIRFAHASGLDLNTEVSGDPLLHCLVTWVSHSPQAAHILLDIGVNPYIPDGIGMDAFLAAALSRKEAFLKILLDHARAHPDETHWTHHLPPQEGSTPEAYDLQVQQICKALYAAGLIDKKYSTDSAHDKLFERGTLLHEATGELLQALIQWHADPNIANANGRWPIHVASLRGNTDKVDVLMGLDGADANILDGEGRSPLHLAALRGHVETVETLLRHGAKANLADSRGFCPLHLAVWKKHLQIAQTLLSAHPKAVLGQTRSLPMDFDGDRPSGLSVGERWRATPLHIAAMKGDVDLVRLIVSTVEQNPDMDVGDLVRLRTDDESTGFQVTAAGPTALHMVLHIGRFYARSGRPVEPLSEPMFEIARILMDHGADVAGVANHLELENVLRFREFPDLWDRLRVGVGSG